MRCLRGPINQQITPSSSPVTIVSVSCFVPFEGGWTRRFPNIFWGDTPRVPDENGRKSFKDLAIMNHVFLKLSTFHFASAFPESLSTSYALEYRFPRPCGGCPAWCRSGCGRAPVPPPGRTPLRWTAASYRRNRRNRPDGTRCPEPCAPSRWHTPACHTGRTWCQTYCEQREWRWRST